MHVAISAFANTEGGRLLIGVRDSGEVAGCRVDEEFHMVQCAAEMHCTPAVAFESQVWKHGYLRVLEVKIPPSCLCAKDCDNPLHNSHFVNARILDCAYLPVRPLADDFVRHVPGS